MHRREREKNEVLKNTSIYGGTLEKISFLDYLKLYFWKVGKQGWKLDLKFQANQSKDNQCEEKWCIRPFQKHWIYKVLQFQ